MNVKKLYRSQPMYFVFGAAALLLLGSYAVPMRASLGQGISEHIVDGWQATLNPKTGEETLQILHDHEIPAEIRLQGLPASNFTQTSPDGMRKTAVNQLDAIKLAYQQSPQQIEIVLGTYKNAPGVFHPFSSQPIAYSKTFLNNLSKMNVNPKVFGGPDIPPNTVAVAKLSSGILQIDTKANGNTIVQCQPGQKPQQLVQLLTKTS